MPNQFKTKEFKALQNEYYGKLKEQGFSDIESSDSPNEFLESWHGVYFQNRHSPSEFSEISAYYHSANDIVSHFEFKTHTEKEIWEMHALGIPINKISQDLGLTTYRVHKSIKEIRSQFMGNKESISINRVEIRNGTVDDERLIYSSWLRPLYCDNDLFNQIDYQAYLTKYSAVVKSILARDSVRVRIACPKDDPDTILGYSVLEIKDDGVTCLHWVYVKKAWRQLGIASKLIPNTITYFTHLTNLGSFANKPKHWIFDPFI